MRIAVSKLYHSPWLTISFATIWLTFEYTGKCVTAKKHKANLISSIVPHKIVVIYKIFKFQVILTDSITAYCAGGNKIFLLGNDTDIVQYPKTNEND